MQQYECCFLSLEGLFYCFVKNIFEMGKKKIVGKILNISEKVYNFVPILT